MDLNPTTTNLGQWLTKARAVLAARYEHPALEALLLAAACLQQPRAWVVAHPETRLLQIQQNQLDCALAELINGRPLAYISGQREFYNLLFSVTPQVLIPRPETELLVETALAWLNNHKNRRKILDVGTGSGCIAITLARLIQDAQITASDLLLAPLQVAKENAKAHQVLDRVSFVQTDLLSGFHARFDLVVANLPYIPSSILDDLEVARHEPRSALDGGPDGLSLIFKLLSILPRYLNPGSFILLEIESGQGVSAPAMAANIFPKAEIDVLQDFSRLPRLLTIYNSNTAH